MRFRQVFAFLTLSALPLLAASIPAVTKPEEVGLSKERLLRIHDSMQRHMDAHDITGAVTLVARRGRIAHFEAHGVMNLESKKPMGKDSLFWIASMSKPVTAVAILMLLEEGKIRLNDPVSKFLPEFKEMKVASEQERPAGAKVTPPTFYSGVANRQITIQDLLTHVSGLLSGGPSASEATRIARKPGETLADYIPRVATTPLDFQPGSRWTYSPSAAFDTLGRIVEVISGQPFDKFLRQRIFDPLGMKDIFFHPTEEQLSRVATAYHRDGDTLKKVDTQVRLANTTYFSGAGGLMSTAEDYLPLGEMLVSGGQWNGKRLLSPRTVELMSSVFVPDTMQGRRKGLGFGLSVEIVTDPIIGGRRQSQGTYGWDGAFGTAFWVDPKEKTVLIMMVQTDNPNRQVDRDFENAVMQAIVE